MHSQEGNSFGANLDPGLFSTVQRLIPIHLLSILIVSWIRSPNEILGISPSDMADG